MKSPSLVIVALGGLATALAFPLQPIPQFGPLCLWPLIFVGPTPYFARLMKCETVRETIPVSLAFGVPWILLAGVWVFRMFDAAGWILIWLPVVAVVVFGMLAIVIRRTSLPDLITWPVLWMTIEFVRSECTPIRLDWFATTLDPLNFTWFSLGHPRCYWPPAAQSADLIGGYGLSLSPLISTLLLARFFSRRTPSFLATILMIAICAADAGYCWRQWQADWSGPMVHAGVVQSERFNRDVLIDLTEKLLARQPHLDLVVWPEESFAATDSDRDFLHQFAKQHHTVLVAGVETDRPGGGHFNLAWWLPHDGEPDQYFKQQRVPFVETHPSSGQSKTFPLRLRDENIPVGILICYDVDFPWNARRVVGELGARLLLMPTLDDVTWGGTQHAQHALLPRLRAIENRCSLVQAATSGYSQILDPRGHVVAVIPFCANTRPQRTTLYREGAEAASVPASMTTSFYTRAGHWIMPAVALIINLTLIWALFRAYPALAGSQKARILRP